MLVNRIVLNALLKRNTPFNVIQTASCATGGFHDERQVIGKREWVGYGVVSYPHYCDRADYPMPAVRFKEITGDLTGLREKEKGDWKKLTLEEKKKLYRASFRQTFAEVYAPTGEWKSVAGWTLFFTSLAIWAFIIEKKYLYAPLPDTFKEEHREKMLQYMLVHKHGHLTGVSSKWDYEKNDWK